MRVRVELVLEREAVRGYGGGRELSLVWFWAPEPSIVGKTNDDALWVQHRRQIGAS